MLSDKPQSRSNATKPVAFASLKGDLPQQWKLLEGSQDRPGKLAAIFGLLLSLAFIGIQIYILYYTFKLERIGCECSKDFRRVYAQVYIIMSFAVYVALGILETLTDAQNFKVMAATKGTLNAIMFVAGIVYTFFVWQYISRLRRIKCVCSESLARDIWEIVNYIEIAVLVLSFIIVMIAMLYYVSIVQSLTSSTGV